MATLHELEAAFVRYEERDGSNYIVPVQTIAMAHGLKFLCPKCFAENGGPRGTHMVICWSATAGAPDHARPLPGRWRLTGTEINDCSLMEEPGKTRSVLLMGGCNWHGFVTNGVAE